MFDKKRESVAGREALIVSGLSDYSLKDTLECGQCFRYVQLKAEPAVTEQYPDYVEYMTVVGSSLVFVGQRNREELIFYGVSDEEFDSVCRPYFALDVDYEAIREDIISRTDSEFLLSAVKSAGGIRLLSQEPWETVFSFIISQNNNIPRIMKIIKRISASYGRNLALERGLSECPLACGKCVKNGEKLDTGNCAECGVCYTFPTAAEVCAEPELLLDAHPGFRYRYLTDAAQKVLSGEVNIDDIISHGSYLYTIEQLKKITGVGDKVASCAALFAFGNLEAFPIDVWMKRAINEYFDGELDPVELGPYAGVAQQYIFHHIRTMSSDINS